MALSLICPSCGFRWTVGDELARKKVRCPDCGVMAQAPDAATTTPAAGPKPTPLPQDDEERAAKLLEEVEHPGKQPTPRRKAAAQITDATAPSPPLEMIAPPRSALPTMDTSEDEDDGLPYAVTGADELECPQCRLIVEPDAVLCLRCGLDFRKGKKVVRKFEPMTRSWDIGIQQKTRRILFLIFGSIGVVLLTLSASSRPRVAASVATGVFVLTLLAFTIGSYHHIELSRDRKGRVKLGRTIRLCFFPLPTEHIDIRRSVGVRTEKSSSAGMLEWIICGDLVIFGIIPGIVFWFLVISKDRLHVVITRDRGRAEEVLYRGTDEALANEVAAALRDAGRLTVET
jgi:hypothetical protein